MQLSERQRLIVAAVGMFIAGLVIGWFAIGWGLWPVTYYDADPFDLRDRHKEQYVQMVADSYNLTSDLGAARARLEGWPEEELAGILSNLTTAYMKQGRGTEVQRINTLATDLGIQMDLAPVPVEEGEKPPKEKTGWNTFFAICGIVLALLFVLVGGALLWSNIQKRRGGQFGRQTAGTEVDVDTALPPQEAAPRSYGAFVTTYNVGEDSYDDCFPIETDGGEFLGECGVGISEVLSDGEPSLVTAFEVWLFDKSDIRTVTKVLMSENAYGDEALRERLAPKGEAVLAEPGKTVVLETAALRVEAQIKEMEYGAGEGPENGHFSRLTVELVATPREAGGEGAPF